MIEPAASVSTPPKGALVPPGAARTADFLITLAAFLDASAATAGGGPASPAPPAKRQALTGGGKDLPADTPDEDAGADLIWLPTGLILPPPVPVVQAIALPGGAAPVAPFAADAAPASPSVQAEAAGGVDGTPPLSGATLAGAGGIAQGSGAIDGLPGTAREPAVKPDFAIAPDDAPARQPAQSQQVQSQQTQPLPPPLVQPAGQAFAAAITAAVQVERDERAPGDLRASPTVTAAGLEAAPRPAVRATGDARHAALDLRQDDGLRGMIDHIELLRDQADAADTRIRLMPDALGAVDVAVRREGDRVHVHFSAENQASARLIHDAQPRLAELAEARGVRLGETSVDTGAGQPRHSPAPGRPAPATAPAPTPAVTAVAGAAADITDHRIA